VDTRLLTRTSVPPYTPHHHQALPGEPQALDADQLDAIVRAAGDRQLRAWHTTHRRMLTELEHLRAHVHSPHVTRAARALERELNALDQKLR